MRNPCFLSLFLALGALAAETPPLDRDAVDRCLMALKLDPMLDAPFRRLVILYQKADKAAELEKDVREAIGKPEWGTAGLVLLARVLVQESKLDDAWQVLSDALKASPQAADLLDMKAQVAVLQGKDADALLALEQAAGSLPDGERRQQLRERRAALLFKAGRPEDARTLLFNSLQASPADPLLFASVFQAFQQHQRHEDALAAIETHLQALSRKKADLSRAQRAKLQTLVEMGRATEALELFEEVTKARKTGDTRWNEWMELLLKLEARPDCAWTVRLYLAEEVGDSTDLSWTIALARAYLASGERDKADPLLAPWRDAAKAQGWVEPEAPAGEKTRRAHLLARLFAQLGRLSCAAEWERLALRHSPDRSDIRWDLEELLGQLEDLEGQRKECQEILKTSPESDEAVRARRWLYRSFLDEGTRLWLENRWEDAAAAFEASRQYATGRNEIAASALWHALALRKFNQTAQAEAWPSPEDIPTSLMLSPLEGLEVSATWVAGIREPPTPSLGVSRPPEPKGKPSWTFEPPDPDNSVTALAGYYGNPVCLLESGSLVCLELWSGRPLWISPACSGVPLPGQLATNGDIVVQANGTALEARNVWKGSKVWTRYLGFRPSALASRSTAIVAVVGDRDSVLIAIRPKTGEVAWRQRLDAQRSGPFPFPLEVRVAGGQVIVVRNGVFAYGASDGRLLWRYVPSGSGLWSERIWDSNDLALALEWNSGFALWSESTWDILDRALALERNSGRRLVITFAWPIEPILRPTLPPPQTGGDSTEGQLRSGRSSLPCVTVLDGDIVRLVRKEANGSITGTIVAVGD
jgi:Tfp pilus assembly protein PilF